ncbi:ABC transporter permease [Microvirga sp. TS319]|uniref:ABC transporter permease n=1 Tax=Microvirga sp. TS319 TaxID=3241165 RepID=UPI00351A840C
MTKEMGAAIAVGRLSKVRLPVRGIVIAAAMAVALLAAQALGLLDDIIRRWDDIAFLSVQHMQLAAISGGLAILVGMVLGIVLSRRACRKVAEPVMQALNVGTTIPTLAVLALSMSVLGIGALPAIFALWLMTLLPIVRNTYIGILEVPPHLIEAATGMGMRPWQILWRVEVPNALYVIFAGIRTAVTVNVGTVPLAFLIGAGGLGELIFTGIDLSEPGMMLAGAIPTAMLAVITDFVIALVTRIVVPRGVMPET